MYCICIGNEKSERIERDDQKLDSKYPPIKNRIVHPWNVSFATDTLFIAQIFMESGVYLVRKYFKSV